MSPSGCLYLLTIVGLILPTRGQTLEEATSNPLADSTTVNVHALIQTPDAVRPELQTSTLQASATHPADPTKGTTLSKQLPDQDFTTAPALRTTGSSEDDPFSYDEATLRKRGLLVAAVLFITGIVILTSGKCRQLPRLCRNHNRAYRILTKARPEREDTGGAKAGTDGLSPPPSQACPP
ncbi:FXYD domain-containing ion transport regulator 5 isoform X2 [Pteronotus mesoamericanus]|uniref:FXYD domain-containing ion transport regulator 5 isoform X2 n=1 Tax=Pteronotus mesoamericanus TaxID=1884717 RepID=UPI0023EB4DDC|nr:FXYD domain-containing ion transport regulator 5 isoform X2 [Pteronotus parnellii mesoamericanus]